MLSKAVARTALRRAAGAAVALGARRAGLAPLSRAAAAAVAAHRPAAAAAAAAARAPVRAFATAQKGGGKAAPPAVAKPSPAAQLQAVKTELGALLSKEVQEISAMGMEADHPYNAYVKEHGLTISHSAETGEITISKSLHGYDVKVLFRAQPDPDEDDDLSADAGADADADAEDADAAEAKGKGKDGKDADADAEEDEPTHNYSFIVNVTPSGAAAGAADAFSVFAVSAKEDKLWFEGLRVAAQAASLDDYPDMDYNDLPTALQDKIADFMDLLKIDEEFAQFVPAVAAEVSRVESLNQLQRLHKFVSN